MARSTRRPTSDAGGPPDRLLLGRSFDMDSIIFVWRVRLWVAAAAAVLIATDYVQPPETAGRMAISEAAHVAGGIVCAASEKATTTCGARQKQAQLHTPSVAAKL